MDWPKLFGQAFTHLTPGGYIELFDTLNPVVSDDGTLTDDSLELCVGGDEMPTVSAEERELSVALIKATVDSYEYGDGLMRLTKRLDYNAQ